MSLAAAVWGAVCLWSTAQPAAGSTDFDHLWYAAGVFLRGDDPYAAVGPGRAFDFPFPLLYPATALVAVSPLSILPLEVARATFVGVSSALLAWAVTRDSWWRVGMFVSAPFWNAAMAAQWSILVTAAVLLPALGWIAGAKPTVGIAVLGAASSGRRQLLGLVGATVLLLLSIAIMPSWPLRWLETIRGAHHMSAPITHVIVGGPLILLALLRWRRPEARLLAALACVPQSTVTYEGLYFFLFPGSPHGLLQLVGASWIAFVIQGKIASVAATTEQLQWWMGHVMVLVFYAPALVIVLRRPNEGEAPAWVNAIAVRVSRSFTRSPR